MSSLGPDLGQAVLLPLIEDFAQAATAHRASRKMPELAEHTWAWTMNAGEGELIVTINGYPMVDFDLELLRLARPIMVALARVSGHPIKLVRFDRRANSIETIA